jgi:hypothetical protein
MASVEYDGLLNDTRGRSWSTLANPSIIVAFRTERFGVVQVKFEPPTQLADIEKSVEEMDAKLSTPADEPNLNMFTQEDRYYIKKWCTAVWICVFTAGHIGGQNS